MRIVVLGTGTEVGKTFVSAGIVAKLAAHERAAGLKPIETGSLEGADGLELGRVSNPCHTAADVPHRYQPSLSPKLAAALAGREIDVVAVAAWVAETAARAAYQSILIETAGGVFSPLGMGQDNLDLAQLLEPATLVLVARNRLGVLHDVLACCLAMAVRGRTPDLIVLSAAAAADASAPTNARELRALCTAPVFEVGVGDRAALGRIADWITARHRARTCYESSGT